MRGIAAALGALGRGLASRAGASIMLIVVAVVAVAAAAAGPIYFSASQLSILRDNLATAPVLGRGFEVVQYGAVGNTLSQLQSELAGAAPQLGRLVRPPINSIEAVVIVPSLQSGATLAWRTGVCDHLVIEGRCPVAPGQVIISRSFAYAASLRIGQTFPGASYGTFEVTGIYTPPGPAPGDYWFDRAASYFPYESPPSPGQRPPPATQDALFTPQSTFTEAPAAEQGQTVVDTLLDVPAIRAGDVSPLQRAVSSLADNSQLTLFQAVVTTQVPATLATVKSAWSALAIPVLLVTLQMLGLAWLLLFLLVTESVGSRGSDIALAKLRGQGRVRTALFGVSEPMTVTLLSLPAGALVGWWASTLLAHALLRRGTPVGFPALGWGTAAAATAGGLAAIFLGSWRTLRRPVVDQLRRAGGRGPARGWVVDSVLLTGAVAGLAELAATGKVSSAHRNSLSLLVPGLLGVAVAVVGSRLLPLLCRIAARSTGRSTRPGLARYLALRHVARRPGGARTTIMLATSFALATFALSSWALERSNYATVADATVGAPVVVSVSTAPGTDLGALVARADPTGRGAAAVEEYGSNGTVTLAVDPRQWSRVADIAPSEAARLERQLAPPAPPPLKLDGDGLRLGLVTRGASIGGSLLGLDVLETGATAPTPALNAILPASGSLTTSASLASCPCIVEDVSVGPRPGHGSNPIDGTVTLTDLEVHDRAGWHRVNSGFTDPASWRSDDPPQSSDIVTATASGLAWSFQLPPAQTGTLVAVDRPSPVPAVAARAVAAPGSFSANGLDGRVLPVEVVQSLPFVPGAPDRGVVVDRSFAELAASGNLTLMQQQVWMSAGAAPSVIRGLTREGVTVVSRLTQHDARSALTREGPGLAGLLFLGEAGAAAVLAAGGAILGLYLSARRRRYELAALNASGVRRRTLFAALASEQSIVLAFGIVVGVATGVVASIVAIRDVPAFLSQPVAPSLATFPSVATLAAGLAPAVAIVVLAAIAASRTLTRRIRLEQLREAPT